ncbi:hypothetical protein [Nostoc sp. KVJ20]|uniref:hypothetical protein n=1 Tax=Nostoc sp. KVJ20 TaxID=457944 RepID=UPI00114C9EC7|nr:hypothetical protein [Nostoc sp. KVJ20]
MPSQRKGFSKYRFCGWVGNYRLPLKPVAFTKKGFPNFNNKLDLTRWILRRTKVSKLRFYENYLHFIGATVSDRPEIIAYGGRLRHRKKAGRVIALLNSCSRSSAAVWEEAIAQALVVRTLTDDKT